MTVTKGYAKVDNGSVASHCPPRHRRLGALGERDPPELITIGQLAQESLGFLCT